MLPCEKRIMRCYLTKKDIMELIANLNDEGCTVLMVTHDPQSIRAGATEIQLRDGRVLEIAGI